ncbi:MAG: tail fiber protein [Alphaproteobacteria bacterium]|nr:tail fiber protein [Alphaproteobacteria bacterium]
MSFDSQGNFTRNYSWEQDRLNDIGIVSDRHDDEDDNFANALNNCFCRDGRAIATGNFKMGSYKITGLGNGTSSNDAVNKSQLDSTQSTLQTAIDAIDRELGATNYIGDIKASLQNANHGNWLICDGQAVSRTTYADLFSLIGTHFGTGDGSTTFNVPDYRGKFLRGLGGDSAADIYTAQEEGLPNITGEAQLADDRQTSFSGALYKESGSSPNSTDSGTFSNRLGFDASKSNAIYGASEHVTPVNQAVNWFIKALEES